MRKTILVPLDGSPSAANALEYAIGLAIADGSQLELLAVLDPLPLLGRTPLDELDEPRLAAARAELDDILRRASARAAASGVAATHAVVLGSPAPRIVERAAHAHADAIVMGTHGRSGFRRFFMGSIAEAVLRTAPCPVVTVRERNRAEPFEEPHLPGDAGGPVYVMRLVETDPHRFSELYDRIASFMRGAGTQLPGIVDAQLFGSQDCRRIAIVAQFRTQHDWAKAQWDARLGALLEAILGSSDTLELNLYHGERFTPRVGSANA